jgi:hypothetical protein
MCEHVVARSAEAFALGDLWAVVEGLERYGLGGWGWGAAWTTADGVLAAHRDPRSFRDDPAAADLAGVETTSLLVHLRIEGRADSEVGQRWLEDHWADHADATLALATMHDRFDGQANLMALGCDGEAHVYAGNTENPVFTYRLGSVGLASTGLYSLDRSFFRLVAPGARSRRVVHPGHGVTLGPDGSPHAPARELRSVG